MERDKLIHDINAPLNNLKMLITILEKSEMEKGKLIEHLKKIESDMGKALENLPSKI